MGQAGKPTPQWTHVGSAEITADDAEIGLITVNIWCEVKHGTPQYHFSLFSEAKGTDLKVIMGDADFDDPGSAAQLGLIEAGWHVFPDFYYEPEDVDAP